MSGVYMHNAYQNGFQVNSFHKKDACILQIWDICDQDCWNTKKLIRKYINEFDQIIKAIV